jgi:hypothetical protein
VNGNHWETWNTSGTLLDNAVNLNAHVCLHNNWNLHAGVTRSGLSATYCDRCTRGGPVLRTAPGLYPWFGVNGDSRRRIIPSLWVNLGYGDEGRSRWAWLSPSVNLRLSTRFDANIGAAWNRNHANIQWFGNFTDAAGTHYSFARLEQRTLSLNVRVDYTATPDLTVQFYGEPFVSTGTYSDFREVSGTPRAAAYDQRFVPFTPPSSAAMGFTVKQLRTNAVARWEYLPGSTLYLVWSHGRQGSTERVSERAWSSEYRDLLELHPDNTFLIKIAYWLNR